MAEKILRWEVLGGCEQGDSHVRSGLPNQDAIEWSGGDDGQPPVILAVSDGHGSPRSFRSDTGSRLAVRTAVTILREYLAHCSPTAPIETKREMERRLPQAIVKEWRKEVDLHLAATPLDAGEIELLGGRQPHLAYGATILAIAVTRYAVFYLQLGDGDILSVADDGSVSSPIPEDPSLIANETTSLCQEKAPWLFRFGYRTLVDSPPPALVLVSSDGYPNSFSTRTDYEMVGADMLRMISSAGLEPVRRGLSSWLQDASREGSGDDVTLGIICRRDVIGPKGEDLNDAPSEPPGKGDSE